jgi:hypothetical protein
VRHTRFQVLTTSPLCMRRGTTLCPTVAGCWGEQLGEGSTGTGFEWWRRWCSGRSKATASAILCDRPAGVPQVCKLRQQQQQHPQRPVPPRVLRRLPQRQRLLPAAPPPKQPLPPPPQQAAHAVAPAKQPRASTNHTARPPRSARQQQHSCGSGVDDDGQCDDGGFKPGTASVVAEAAVERKEVRRVRPLLSVE